MAVIVAGLISLVAGAIWWAELWRRDQRLVGPLVVDFGARKEKLTAIEWQAIIGEHLRQQRWAFALVWFSILLGVILGAFLLGRLIITWKVGYAEVIDTIGLVGDISVGRGAFMLYKSSATRFQEVLKSLLE